MDGCDDIASQPHNLAASGQEFSKDQVSFWRVGRSDSRGVLKQRLCEGKSFRGRVGKEILASWTLSEHIDDELSSIHILCSLHDWVKVSRKPFTTWRTLSDSWGMRVGGCRSHRSQTLPHPPVSASSSLILVH
eukprot:9504102-Pyramimonas_sp.AAC.5